ncbi:MAG: hypothetical protein M1826_000757 [Phylliscum demangeonii]|nr:MAG: hypothetical protein M1826_000757 [Phylliscum demangeonii]
MRQETQILTIEQHVNLDPSSSAATAAATAFLANRASNASLSSAAAAAALRSHTTSPVSVASTQTKRTVRRQNSVGSNASAAGSLYGANGTSLRRQGSTGSMTERTFRATSPSPNRPPSRARIEPVPPVPPLPKSLPPIPKGAMPPATQRPASSLARAPPIPQKSHRRASSVEAPAARMASPPPSLPLGRGVSVDRSAATSPGVLAARRASGTGYAQEMGLARPESRSSVNFSYPISPRSPTPSMEDGRRMSSPPPDWNRQIPAQAVSPPPAPGSRSGPSTPIKKPKKTAVPGSTNGPVEQRRLSRSNDPAVKASGIALPEPEPAVVPAKKKKKKAATTANARPVSAEYPSPGPVYHSDLDPISEDGDSPRPPVRFKTRAAALLVKQPSIVREDREQEEKAETERPPANTTARVLSQPNIAPLSSVKLSRAAPHARSSSQPAASIGKPPATRTSRNPSSPAAESLSAERARAPARGGRPQSLSPTRYAHFASTTSSSASPLAIKHEPPLRALSPAKSALKRSSTPRPESAASQTSMIPAPGHLQGPVEPSDVSAASDDGHGALSSKKKHARVSFGDGAVVMGEGGGRSSVSTAKEDESGAGEYLTPRPPLPLFGSVRDQREKSDGLHVSSTGSPSFEPIAALSHSSDRAVGAVFLQDAQMANTTTTDPAGVGGYDVAPLAPEEIAKLVSGASREPHGPTGTMTMLPSSTVSAPDAEPLINSTQPTPSLAHSTMDPPLEAAHEHMDATPALAGVAEPEPKEVARNHSPTSPAVGHIADGLKPHKEEHHADTAEDEDEKGDVYSDAAEDIAQADGDGFGSIDAVVDSSALEPAETPTKGSMTGANGEPLAEGDWKEAQAYWSSLSERQRLEMERAAAAATAAAGPTADRGGIEAPKTNFIKKKKKTTAVAEQESLPAAAGPAATPRAGDPPSVNGSALASVASKALPNPTPSSTRGVAAQPVLQPTSALRSSMRAAPVSHPKTSRAARADSLPAPATRDAFSEAVQREIRRMTAAPLPPSAAPTAHQKKRGGSMSAIRSKHADGEHSDSSASSSSFKKSRRARASSASAGGAVALPRTMRTTSPAVHTRTTGGPGRLSVRSLSPPRTTARKPFSPPPSAGAGAGAGARGSGTRGTTMRTSLRSPAPGPSGAPTLRGPRPASDRGKSPSRLMALGRSGKSAPSMFKRPGGLASRRFSDDSDDDGGGGGGGGRPALAGFRSRFHDDSSDEDDEAAAGPRAPRSPLTPVRGIPRRTTEAEREESSDLPDSSDDENTARAAAARGATGTRHAGLDGAEGAAPTTTTTITGRAEPDAPKRRTFFGALGWKRDGERSPAQARGRKTTARSVAALSHPERISMAGAVQADPPGSAAATPATTQPPRPRISKRHSSSYVRAPPPPSWPIVEPSPRPARRRLLSFHHDHERPVTSDGVVRPAAASSLASAPRVTLPEVPEGMVSSPRVAASMPEMAEDEEEMGGDRKGRRVGATQQQQQPPPPPQQAGVYGRNGRKKRFGALRRVFGLLD